LNGAGKVTAYDSPCSSERIVSVEAIDRVESNGVDFDENFSWSGSRDVD
jgi:hypothetical protein